MPPALPPPACLDPAWPSSHSYACKPVANLAPPMSPYPSPIAQAAATTARALEARESGSVRWCIMSEPTLRDCSHQARSPHRSDVLERRASAARARRRAVEAFRRAHEARERVTEVLNRRSAGRAIGTDRQARSLKSREASEEWCRHLTEALENASQRLSRASDERDRLWTEFMSNNYDRRQRDLPRAG